MIQRIQTVYLVFAAALLAASPFAGALTSQAAAAATWFVPSVGAATGIAFVAALIAVFLFANRTRQRLVVILAQVMVVISVAAAFAGRKLAGPVNTDALGVTSEGWAILALPAAAYVLLWMARRAIDRDSELVRSMDRIR